MARFVDHLEAAHQVWRQSGKDPSLVWTGFQGAMATSWGIVHKERNDPRLTSALAEFIDASRQATDIDKVWRTREYCSKCGETYKLENMACCCDCECNLCPRDVPFSKICPRCGGEMY